MSTKGSLFWGDHPNDPDLHVYVDILDNRVHIEGGGGHATMTPDAWRDIVAECAGRALKATRYGERPREYRPPCKNCGLPDVGHFTPGPCSKFEPQGEHRTRSTTRPVDGGVEVTFTCDMHEEERLVFTVPASGLEVLMNNKAQLLDLVLKRAGDKVLDWKRSLP